jgi:hypothetical protein
MVQTPGNLDAGLVSAMYRLYDRYYGAASETAFQMDLRAKDKVILLRDMGGELQGFSTLVVTEFAFDGRTHRAIFSGDTIIDRRHWGEHALAFAWIELAGSIKRRFYPHWEIPTPVRENRLLDRLAGDRFGDAYDPKRGVISFPRSRGHLRSEFAEIPPQQRGRPEVRFFLERNPGYRRGDELACIAELHADNLRPMARRLFSKGMAA